MDSVSTMRASIKSGKGRSQTAPEAPELVFIVQNKPEKFSKKTSTQIRKHVMKDIGKSRRKDKRNRQVSLELPESIGEARTFQNFAFEENSLVSHKNAEVKSCTSFCPQSYFQTSGSLHAAPECLQQPHQDYPYDFRDSRALSQSPPAIERLGSGRGDPFARYPVPMKGQMRELLDEAFDDRYHNIGPWRDACLPIGMLGPAAFHQMLSNALLNIRCRRPTCTPSDTYESIRHHGIAVKIVKEGMSEPVVATSDAFIGAIVGLTCYHCHTGNHDAWKLHMNGLEQVIRLRGGIHTLDSNKRVRALLGWSDATGSSVEDIHPRFPLPSFIPDIETLPSCPTISPHQDHILAVWLVRFTNYINLLDLMNHLQRFNYNLQYEAQNQNRKIFQDGDFATSYLFPLIHQCLRLSGNSIVVNEHDTNILQAVRISCLLYTAEIRRLFGINGVAAKLHTQKLKFYLENSKHDWGELGMLRLWCLAMGGMESEGADRAWFAAEIASEGAEMGYPMWHDLETQMEEMVWFTDAHRPKFWSLYHGFEELIPSPYLTVGGESQDQYPEPSDNASFGVVPYPDIGW
ncbi:hypothetical protein BKA64DRAFT_346789 [Cadophora sp. MPI-SDFR-AT-0126]|nr:hypothetical protein BKA64DRAFT_346789 [Leotiomycetes sp. MPI-SDFR-AT-0126]